MKEIQINKWCDMCYREGENTDQPGLPIKTPATHAINIGIGIGENTRPVIHEIDVCDVHAKPIAELALFINETPLAVKPAAEIAPKRGTNPNPDVAVCPVCKHGVTRSQIINHVWQSHRKDARPEPPKRTCPDCGVVYEKAQGLSQHRRAEHGFDALLDALSGVKGYKVTGRERESL